MIIHGIDLKLKDNSSECSIIFGGLNALNYNRILTAWIIYKLTSKKFNQLISQALLNRTDIQLKFQIFLRTIKSSAK